jgi:hypothetical protein
MPKTMDMPDPVVGDRQDTRYVSPRLVTLRRQLDDGIVRFCDYIFRVMTNENSAVIRAQLLQIWLKDSERELSSVANVILDSVENTGVISRDTTQNCAVMLVEEATFQFHRLKLCFVVKKTYQFHHRAHDPHVAILQAN